MNNYKVAIVYIFLSILLISCGPSSDEMYDSGYSDGYAEGYNTECKIRSTLVAGDWKDKNYSRGYQNGRVNGVRDCNSSK